MQDAFTRTLLLISGSTRTGSTNMAVLSTARTLLPPRWTADMYPGIAALPHFNPDLEASGPPSTVIGLRASIREANALLFCTPEYAGAMPGALKNLLEWTIGDTVMSGKPVGWINPSVSPQRAAGTYAALGTVLSYTGASIVKEACRGIPVTRSHISGGGTVDDPETRDLIGAVVLALTSSVA